MKSLGRAIDQILKMAPSLEPRLAPLKSKWKRYPSRSMDYWKELASTITSEAVNETDREKIKKILLPKQYIKPTYTFEESNANDKLIGVLPEHLADRIKYHDLVSIRMAMLQTKASLTKDKDLMMKLTKRSARLEIAMKKIWYDIKEHFKLWDRDIKVSIKKRGSLLVLVDDSIPFPPTPLADHGFAIRVDPETLKGLFRMLGIDPPPNLFLG